MGPFEHRYNRVEYGVGNRNEWHLRNLRTRKTHGIGDFAADAAEYLVGKGT
jgi:hypothetical protein